MNQLSFYKSIFIFSIFSFALTTAIAQPNFVIVVLDDQGWTGSSVVMDPNFPLSKSDFYQTPEMEFLAMAGMTFSQGYAPAPKCSPSRCSILTGQTTARNNFTSTDNNIAIGRTLIEPEINTALDGDDITYAEWLKSTELGYRTAHFGKWHQGNTTASSPSSNGFDFNDGTTNNGDGSQGGVVQADPKKIFDLTNRSIEFIQDAVADGVPFSIQLSHYAVHAEIEARQETIDLYNDPNQRPPGVNHTNVEYGAMTEDTDDGLGQLLAEITNLGIDDNTYVIFMSDNGGQANFTNNVPLFRGKTFIYEGGIRVPFIIKGPNIAPNSYIHEAVVGYDLFPTIAELTGSPAALPNDLDGQSIVPLLTGEPFNREKSIYFHSPHYDNNAQKTPRSAIVDKEFKLVVEYETGNMSLYNLDIDIGEEVDITANNTTLARNLCIELRDHLKEVNASMPALDPTHEMFSGTGTDIDADGLPDEWEFRELLSYTYGPDDDPDNDGENNLAEYDNGTDPYTMDSTSGECDPALIFANETTNAVCFEELSYIRKCYTNNIPDHAYGPFGGMGVLEGQDFEYSMCLYPELGDSHTELIVDPDLPGCGNGIIFGTSIQGVNYSPFARLYWVNPNTMEENTDWHIEADFTLNIDLNGGHVNAASRYHYHNIPSDYLTNDLAIDGSSHSPLLGYAADGFPIYYKYLYADPTNTNSTITAFESSYALKDGTRPGDGITAPDGVYDGNYVEDYAYDPELSALDECGMRFAVTPEYPDGTYLYVLTDNWPYIPRCLKGSVVDNSFRLGQNCPESTAAADCNMMPNSIEVIENYQFNINIYPNPITDFCNIKIEGNISSEEITDVKIYSSNGVLVYQSEKLESVINLRNLTKGNYFMQIDLKKGQVTKKLLIQ